MGNNLPLHTHDRDRGGCKTFASYHTSYSHLHLFEVEPILRKIPKVTHMKSPDNFDTAGVRFLEKVECPLGTTDDSIKKCKLKQEFECLVLKMRTC